MREASRPTRFGEEERRESEREKKKETKEKAVWHRGHGCKAEKWQRSIAGDHGRKDVACQLPDMESIGEPAVALSSGQPALSPKSLSVGKTVQGASTMRK